MRVKLRVLAEDLAFLRSEGEGGRGSREGKLSYKIFSTNAKIHLCTHRTTYQHFILYNSPYKLFADNCQIVLSGIRQFPWWIQKKIHFQVYHFYDWLCQPGVLSKYPTVWLDGFRLHPRYIFKNIKIKIAESYINNI